MIYLKIRADSKQDGIKREHVIFTQACLHSRQRGNMIYMYMITSMLVLLPVKFGVGAGEGREI